MVLVLAIPDATLESHATTTASRLEALPAELISDIFKFSNLSSRINLSLTSKFMALVAVKAKVHEVDCDNMSGSTAISLFEDGSVPFTSRPPRTGLSGRSRVVHMVFRTRHGLQSTCRYCNKWISLPSFLDDTHWTCSGKSHWRHVKNELAKYERSILTMGHVVVIRAVLSTLVERARRQKERIGFLTLKYRK